MTSEQIAAFNYPSPIEVWAREIAYQLAVMNERNTPMEWAESFALSDMVMAAIRDREKNHA